MFKELFTESSDTERFSVIIKMKYASSTVGSHFNFPLEWVHKTLEHQTRLMDRRSNTIKIEQSQSKNTNQQNAYIETWTYHGEVDSSKSDLEKGFKRAKTAWLNKMNQYGASPGTTPTVTMKLKKLKA